VREMAKVLLRAEIFEPLRKEHSSRETPLRSNVNFPFQCEKLILRQKKRGAKVDILL